MMLPTNNHVNLADGTDPPKDGMVISDPGEGSMVGGFVGAAALRETAGPCLLSRPAIRELDDPPNTRGSHPDFISRSLQPHRIRAALRAIVHDLFDDLPDRPHHTRHSPRSHNDVAFVLRAAHFANDLDPPNLFTPPTHETSSLDKLDEHYMELG